MDQTVVILAALYDDEAVCFLADRYHTSTRQLLNRYLYQAGMVPVGGEPPAAFRLEANEMEILRGLAEKALGTKLLETNEA